jgi:FkbM family methyltransferase
LYLKAREDPPNIASLNGEELVQKQLLAKFAKGRETMIAFDVGANIGDWTWSLLERASRQDMAEKVRIHSFEPVPTTFQILQKRIDEHPLKSSVQVQQLALSSEDGAAEMYLTGETAGSNSLYPDALRKDQERISIEKSTTHTYCSKNEIPAIHYMKCDVEGHDMEVIHGARRLFDEQRIMAFQFEYNHRWIYSRHFLKDVFDLFEDTDYKLGKITPGGIEIYQDWHPEMERYFEGNYLVLHPEAFDWFTTITGAYDSSNTFNVRQVSLAKP